MPMDLDKRFVIVGENIVDLEMGDAACGFWDRADAIKVRQRIIDIIRYEGYGLSRHSARGLAVWSPQDMRMKSQYPEPWAVLESHKNQWFCDCDDSEHTRAVEECIICGAVRDARLGRV